MVLAFVYKVLVLSIPKHDSERTFIIGCPNSHFYRQLFVIFVGNVKPLESLRLCMPRETICESNE